MFNRLRMQFPLVMLHSHCWLMQRNATNSRIRCDFWSKQFSPDVPAFTSQQGIKITERNKKKWPFMKCQFHSLAINLVLNKGRWLFFLLKIWLALQLCVLAKRSACLTIIRLTATDSTSIILWYYSCLGFPGMHLTGLHHHVRSYNII